MVQISKESLFIGSKRVIAILSAPSLEALALEELGEGARGEAIDALEALCRWVTEWSSEPPPAESSRSARKAWMEKRETIPILAVPGHLLKALPAVTRMIARTFLILGDRIRDQCRGISAAGGCADEMTMVDDRPRHVGQPEPSSSRAAIEQLYLRADCLNTTAVDLQLITALQAFLLSATPEMLQTSQRGVRTDRVAPK